MTGNQPVATGKGASKWGFSVIELLIALAIIFLLVAIALPHLVSARNKANEVSAISSMKVIHEAEAVYQSNYPSRGFSPSLAYLGNNGSTCESTSSTNACLIDPALATGIKDGYIFDLLGDGNTPDLSYSLTATPESSNSEECTFSASESGIIAYSTGPPPRGASAGRGTSGSASCTGNFN